MLLSKEELAKASEIRPDVAEFVSKLPPQDSSDYHATRDGLNAYTAAVLQQLGSPPPEIIEIFHDIPMRDGYLSSLKIHKPSSPVGGPLIVLCFGGGFIAGDNNQLSPIARALVLLFDATVVSINYRLAPEWKFPQAQLDALDSLHWIASNATTPVLASDPTKGFILGGSSAGGSIAAAISRKVQEDEQRLLYPLSGQWLSVPGVMDLASCPEKYKAWFISPEQNANAPVLSKDAIDLMQRLSQWDYSSELRCAVLSRTDIAEQPRTYFQVDGMDYLRDDGLIYEEMLTEAGVPTKIDFYPGCPHGHFMMMAGTPLGNEANIDSVVGFGVATWEARYP